ERSVIKDNTLLPGEWYGGQLHLQPLGQSGGAKSYKIVLMIGADRHEIGVEQASARGPPTTESSRYWARPPSKKAKISNFSARHPKGVSMKLIATGALALTLAINITQPRTALAWGDDGHKVVALIAQSFLDTNALKRVNALLAADTDSLTAHDIAS